MGDDTGCACCQLERQVMSEPNDVPILMAMQNRSKTFTASLSVYKTHARHTTIASLIRN